MPFDSLLLIVCLCSALVAGQSYGFIYPNASNPQEQNMIFTLGQVVDIQWSSPYANGVNLGFVASDVPGFHFFSQRNTGSDFSWTVNVNNSGSTSSKFFLYFENADNNAQHYSSSLFQVDGLSTPNSQSSASSIATTPTPTIQATRSTQAGGTVVIVTEAIPTDFQTSVSSVSSVSFSSTGSAGAAGASVAGTGAPSDSSTFNPGLSSAAKIGIGIGVPLGVIALLGLGFLIGWRSIRHSRAARISRESPGTSWHSGDGDTYDTAAGYRGDLSAYQQHNAKLAQPGQYGYGPMQKPMAQVPGLHELPNPAAEPQELDSRDLGFRSSR